MCDPVTAIAGVSALASAGGALMNSSAQAGNQAAAIRAKNDAAQATAAKEAQLQQQATGVFQSTLKPFQDTNPQTSLNTAQTSNTAAINANAPTAATLAGGGITPNAPKVVQDSASGTVASRMHSIGQNATNLGNLTGYDTNNQTNDRNVAEAARQIGTLGNFASEDANVGQALQGAAVTNSQKAPSPFGDLLGAAGSLGGIYAGQNGAFGNILGKPKLPPGAVLDSVSGIYS